MHTCMHTHELHTCRWTSTTTQLPLKVDIGLILAWDRRVAMTADPRDTGLARGGCEPALTRMRSRVKLLLAVIHNQTGELANTSCYTQRWGSTRYRYTVGMHDSRSVSMFHVLSCHLYSNIHTYRIVGVDL